MAKDNKDTAKSSVQAPVVDEAGAKAAELAATAVAAAVAQEEKVEVTPEFVRPPPDTEVAKHPKKEEEEDYPPDAPNANEPTVPPLEEWLKRGYPKEGYYRRFGKNPQPNWTPPKELEDQPPQNGSMKSRLIGDVPVMCLKTETQCELGGRRYQLIKGREIMMDPNHVAELKDWVKEIEVVS